jgi:hypothetical protein
MGLPVRGNGLDGWREPLFQNARIPLEQPHVITYEGQLPVTCEVELSRPSCVPTLLKLGVPGQRKSTPTLRKLHSCRKGIGPGTKEHLVLVRSAGWTGKSQPKHKIASACHPEDAS